MLPEGGGDRHGEKNTGLMAGARAGLEHAIVALREQLEVANARAERAEADRDALRAELLMAAGVRRDLDAARERLAATSDELALVQAALDRAGADGRKTRGQADALWRADDVRKSRGLLARLWAAWRGE